MGAPLVLSLFPGIGLLDRAFEEEGFCIVRGPDLLWGGDVRSFHPPAGRFDGVIGGPPCQAFSRLRYMNPRAGQKHGNLIPEYERVVGEAAPAWFVMENVSDAPVPHVAGYRVDTVPVRDVWVGGATSRLRSFSFGTPEGVCLVVEQLALHSPDPEPAATASGGIKPGIPGNRAIRGRYMGWKTREAFEKMRRDQGLPDDFLEDAPFTITGLCRVVGNGVPLPMGRAVARAVKRALESAAEAA